MPHKIATNDCYKEAYGSGGNIKWNCRECPACLAREEAVTISRNHKYGHTCKRSNNCSICTTINFRIRVLRHKHGYCFKNCPVCRDRNLAVYVDRIPQYTKEGLIKDLYRYMFKLKEQHPAD
jgi:hypothetical protein